MNAFLLNSKEWELLAEIRVDENAPTLDHRSVSCLAYYDYVSTMLIQY